MCNHFHLPLQSGCDEILRKMRRRYTTAEYSALVHEIRKRCPDAGIGVDVIVGFPGETDYLFKKTYDFVHDLPVSYLHIFTYSERPNTPSLEFPGRVEPRVRYTHSEMLRILGQQKKEGFYRSQLGTSRTVLVESSIENSLISGYTENYVRVFLAQDYSLVNTLVHARLTGHSADGCLGVVDGAELTATSLPVSALTLQIATH